MSESEGSGSCSLNRGLIKTGSEIQNNQSQSSIEPEIIIGTQTGNNRINQSEHPELIQSPR